MAVNYDKLWRILNERGMMKTELIREAKISTNAMAKLGRNEDVRVGILEKICLALDCKMDDILCQKVRRISKCINLLKYPYMR